MLNVSLFILSILFMSLGLFFIILYLNLFTIGYNLLEFVYFIIRSFYCDLFFIGILLLVILLERIRKK